MSGAKHPRFSNRGVLVTQTESEWLEHRPAPEAQTGGRALPVGPQKSPVRGVFTAHRYVGTSAPTPKGRGASAASPDSYVKLLLHRPNATASKYLIAMRATADYYGWTKHFEIWTPKPIATDEGYIYCMDPGRKGHVMHEPGRRHRICRSPVRQGYPKGLTNAFRISRNCSLLDLAEVAHLTEADWCWMDSPFGERLSRDHWERIYQAGIPGRRGVAVTA